MIEEILKLAKECGFRRMVKAVGGGYTGDVKGSERALKAFYHAAFNAGLEAAARVAYGTGDEQMEAQIRALKEE